MSIVDQKSKKIAIKRKKKSQKSNKKKNPSDKL